MLNSLLETAHLLRSPRNARRPADALERALGDEPDPSNLQALREDLGLNLKHGVSKIPRPGSWNWWEVRDPFEGVLSPSNAPAVVRAEIADYLAAGTPLVRVVDPDPERETVTVYRSLLCPRVLSRGEELDGEDVVPGFRMGVAELLELWLPSFTNFCCGPVSDPAVLRRRELLYPDRSNSTGARMRLYSGMSGQFIQDTVHNRIAEKLKDAFFRQYRHQPSPSEVGSWRNSLRAVSQVFDDAGLRDHGVILEYQLPLTSKRLDCLICGHDDDGRDAAVVIELKQWDRCMPTDGDNLVCTRLGGVERDVLHPSAQVGQYQQYLEDTHTAFHEKPEPVRVRSCAYLHNYTAEHGDVLFDGKFSSLLTRYPTFTADDVDPLKDYLSGQVRGGDGHAVLRRIEHSRYRPSKKLMEHVGNVIKGRPEYVLLDEQLVVYDKVRALARRGFDDRRKTVLIVQGGPGTGKSVIAVNLMSDLLLSGRNAHYATGSKAFTETMRKIIGSRGGVQFKYFNSYREAEVNAVDILICDEAHRIREFSRDRFTPRAAWSETAQIDELIHASKLGVFFIDDRQRVRPDEIGSSGHIRQHALQGGCQVLEYRLEAQFRCSGSDAFVNWIDNTLGLERTANVLWEGDERFDFRIYDSPEDLDAAIRARANDGHSARMTAGFCWRWSGPKPDRTLVEDVVIGDYRRPWNAKPEAGRLAPGIPKATLWAHDPNGIAQVGCIYTAQGFEFDYAGVIFGPDLTYDFDRQSWQGNPKRSYDTTVKRGGERFTDLVKNTYRVLLSRGLKGCYVHFMDKDTERFFRSRMEIATGEAGGRRVADAGPPHFEPDEPGS